MDWQATIEDRGAVITFRGLTVQSSPDEPICRSFSLDSARPELGRPSFEVVADVPPERGGSVTVAFDGLRWCDVGG